MSTTLRSVTVYNYMTYSNSFKFLAVLLFVLNSGHKTFRYVGIEGAQKSSLNMKTTGTLER